jgi:type IV pilus assembly protein PilB
VRGAQIYYSLRSYKFGMIRFEEEKQKKKIEELREAEEEDLAKILAQRHNLPYLDISKMTIDLDYLKLIPEEISRSAKIVVFQGVGKNLQIALANPKLEPTKQVLEDLENKGYQTSLFLVSLLSLEKAWEKYREIPAFVEASKGIIDISSEKMEKLGQEIQSPDDLKKHFLIVTSAKERRKISEILELILAAAIQMDVSDVHIEPQEKQIRLRFRLDGVLQDILYFEPRHYQFLLSRIKLVSELKLNVHDKPQDGRFSIHLKGTEIEIRTSTLPGPYGESLVLRILNPKTIALEFGDLGIPPTLAELLLKEIQKPNGMILTTGPTGSGKTTTLYAFLKKIYTPGVKIITLEEPIEYHIQGITQTQTSLKAGYDFASGLRSILRQDPDIIMVGEIRDLDTAKIAINAALTGHLVFSTLHTNDAAGTIPRLIDLGAEPNVLAPAINVSMAQRLVRILCKDCKKQDKPTSEELRTINAIVESFPKNIKKPSLNNISVWRAVGCLKCRTTGYKGRAGIFEAILINDEMERLILETPSEVEIKKAAAKQGILNMQQDGILKVLEGKTSLEELGRIIELETSIMPG